MRGPRSGAERRAAVALVALGLASGWAGSAAAIEPGVTHADPVLASPAAPLRQALVVVPGGAAANGADEEVKALRLLGFAVTTVSVGERPALEAALRGFAASVQSGGDVAVFALGDVLGSAGDLYLTASVPSAEVLARPELSASEGLSLGGLFRRILARGPKNAVAVLDGCRSADRNEACAPGSGALPDAVSVLVAHRLVLRAGAPPVAHVATLGPDLIPLMEKAGFPILDLAEALTGRLAGSDLALATTPSLSRSFAFLPADFLSRLPTACNRVDASLDDAALRRTALDPLVSACTAAAQVYGFSPLFKEKLATAKEQRAFLAATAGCDRPEGATAYLAANPDGLHRAAVLIVQARCRAELQARQVAASPPPPAPPPDPAPRRGGPPSFACRPAMMEPVARLICADPDLSEADGQLGRAYADRLARLDATADRRAFAQEQVAWIARRNAVCNVPSSGDSGIDELMRLKPCVMTMVMARIRNLQD